MMFRHRLGLFTLPLVCGFFHLGLGRPAQAAVLIAGAPGIAVVPSHEVLDHHVFPGPDGTLWFQYPGGHAIRMVTSTTDPEIQNGGDGRFHAADFDEVVRAIESLPARLLEGLQVQVFLLPYPRSGLLSSSADDGGIYLSPGVLDYTPAQIHFLVGHEFGHSYHRTYLPDSDGEGWSSYRQLRGLEDRDRYRADAGHADRPREIFAEDFRVLFAGAVARGNGSIENRDIAEPDRVPGLAAFIRELSGPSGGPFLACVAYPNPLRAGSLLRLREVPDAITEAALIDIGGRRLATLPAILETSGEWRLDTRELQMLQAGAYWLRVSSSSPPVTVPLRWLR